MTSRKQIARAIVSMQAEGVSEQKLAKQLAAYLLTQGRTSELEPLLRDVQMLRAEQGIVEATVTSARRLQDTVIKQIKQLLKEHYQDARGFVLNEVQDKSVVGGVKVTAGDLQLDASVHGKLMRLTQSIEV